MGDLKDVPSAYGASSAPIDPVSGQRGAFPGLDRDEDEDELFYGPASDGMAYLRMVRREAHTVPKLLRVQRSDSVDIPSDQEFGSGGRYEDGAFVAEDLENTDEDMLDPDASDEDDTQDVYYRRLLQRFMHFRELLANPPENAQSNTQLSLPKALHSQARQPQWSYDLRRTAPKPRELISASQDDIIRGLGRIESLLTKANLTSKTERANLGSWAWALLGRCRDIETLGSEDVGVLRSIAKAALALNTRLLRLQNGHAGQDILADADDAECTTEKEIGPEEVIQSSAETGTGATLGSAGASEELEAARNSMLGRLHASESDRAVSNNTGTTASDSEDGIKEALVALDIIVTIVGEAFRQRDLLDMRSAWS